MRQIINFLDNFGIINKVLTSPREWGRENYVKFVVDGEVVGIRYLPGLPPVEFVQELIPVHNLGDSGRGGKIAEHNPNPETHYYDLRTGEYLEGFEEKNQ